MRYRVKRTDLSKLSADEVTLTANVETAHIDAANAVAAVLDFVRANKLRIIGQVEDATGGSANAVCKDPEGRFAIIRAFPEPASH